MSLYYLAQSPKTYYFGVISRNMYHETSFVDIYDEKITLMMPKIHESSVDLGSRRGATRLLTRRGAFGNQSGT